MSSDIQYDHDREDYAEEQDLRYTRSNDAKSRRTPANKSHKRAKSPQSVNGLHRRRRRKMSW